MNPVNMAQTGINKKAIAVVDEACASVYRECSETHEPQTIIDTIPARPPQAMACVTHFFLSDERSMILARITYGIILNSVKKA